MADTSQDTNFVELATEIVSAYVGNHNVATGDLASLIRDVHTALQQAASGTSEPEPEPLTPAVSVKKSVQPDYIVCLEDGKKFKSLKRHLRTDHNLSPEEYRAKWGLARDYPMVAPNYAASRSELAKKMGLGRGRQGSEAMAATAEAAAPARKRGGGRGRKAEAQG
jgi:MucR family transcriptional regulator, transcriptional regulator of exopolysaccharide biosynthesis